MFKLLLASTLVALAAGAQRPVQGLGLFKPRLDGRIVGGVPVEIEDYPYQLSLQYYNSHICGASLISEKFAVTAAHCTSGSTAKDLTIRAGSSIRGSGGVVVNVKAIHQNPAYDSWMIDFDISVLELESPLQFGDAIQVVPLPEQDEKVPVGEGAVCSGWGAVQEGGGLPSKLQAVTVKIVSEEECKQAYGDSAITPRMICAGVGGGKDACQGDSGGPLIVGGKLVGVVSWGYGCARPTHPGVYSKVASMRDFVKEKSGL